MANGRVFGFYIDGEPRHGDANSYILKERGSTSNFSGEPRHEHAIPDMLDERRRDALAEVDNARFSYVHPSVFISTYPYIFL